jgi:hypothetical protein
MTDVNAALTFYSEGQYFNFGDKIGEALVLAVGDHSSSLPFYAKYGIKETTTATTTSVKTSVNVESKLPKKIREFMILAKSFGLLN